MAVSSASTGKPTTETARGEQGSLTDWIQNEIRRTIKQIRLLEITVAMAQCWVSLIVVSTVAVILDHWVMPLPTVVRFVFWFALLGISGWSLLRRVLPLLIYRINPLYAAQMVERSLPELKNSLVSWWQLKHEDAGASRGVVAAVGRQAIGQLRQHDTISLIDSRSTLRWLAFTFGFTAAMVLYLLLSPKSSATSFQRILAPWASIKAPSRVQLEKVTPGTSYVPQGLPCPIKVELRGIGAKDKVEVRWTTDDNQNVDQRFELNAEITGSVYSANLTTDGKGIQQQLTYWVEAGDAVAGPYRLEVRPLPQITLEEARIEFPKYTGLSPQTIKGNGAITAVEGAKVVLKATASSELKRGWVEISERESAAISKPHVVRSIPMVVEGTAVSAEWFLMLNSRQDNPTLAGYSLRGLDPDGNSKPDILLYPLTIQADLAPEVTLRTSRKPAAEGEAIKVSSRGTLPLDIEALDPDFGLAKVVLELRSGSRSIAELNLLDDKSGVRDPWKSRPSISLARYQLRPGEKIQVVAIASDNRQKPGEETSEPNVTRSTALEFELVAPADFKEPAKTENPDGDKSEGEQVANQEQEQSTGNNSGRPNDRGSKNSGGGKKDKSQQGGNTGSSGGESSEGGEEESGDDSQSGSGGSGSGTKSQSSGGNGDSQGEPGEPGEPNEENAEPSQGSGSGGTAGQPNTKKSISKKPQGNSPDNQPQDDSQESSEEPSSDDSGDAVNSNQSGKSGRGKPSNKPNSDNSQPEASDSQSDGSDSASQSGGAGNQNPKRDKSKPSEPFKPEHAGDIFEKLQKLSQKEQQAGSDSSQPNNAGKKNEQSGESKDGSQPKPKQSTGNEGNEQSGSRGKSGLNQSGSKSNSKNPQNDSSDNSNEGNAENDAESSNNRSSDSDKKNQKQSGAKDGSEGDKSQNENGDSESDQSNKDSGKNSDGSQKDPGKNGANSKEDGSQNGNSAEANGKKSKSDGANAEQKNQGKNPGKSDSSQDNNSNKQADNSSKDGSDSSSASKQRQNGTEGKSGDGQGNADKENSGSEGNQSKDKGKDGGKEQGNSKDNTAGQNSPKPNSSKQENGAGSKSNQGEKSDGSNSNDSSQNNADGSGKDGGKNSDSQSKDSNQSGSQGSEGSSGSKSSESGEQGTPDNKSAGDKASDDNRGKADNSGQGSKKPSPNGNAAKADQDSGNSESSSQGSDAESKGESGSKSDSAGSKGSSGTAGGGSSQAGGNPGQARSSGSQERGTGGTESNPDQANLEYSKKAASMVLDYLERQKDQPDPELLKEMNWSPDDLKQFLDHWRTMEEAAKSKNPAVRHRAEQALRSLGIRPREIQSGAVKGADDQVSGLQESGLKTAPPSSLKSSFDAARKALQQRQRAAEKK